MNASVGSFAPRHHHRKFRNPITCYRRRHYKPPGTPPLLSWKFDERPRACGAVEVSARKLAAALWQLRLLATVSDSGGLKCGSCDRFSFQPHAGHGNIARSSHCSSSGYGVGIKDLPRSPLLRHGSSHEIPHKHESYLPYPNLVMEGVTKWDPGCSKTAREAYCLYNHVKLLEDQVTTFSVVSALQAELVQARLRIHELEDEHRSSKKKFENLVRKLREERNSWYIRKHYKMQAIVDELKDELSKERKSRKQIDFLNSKFVNELAKAKSSSKQFMQDYEEQKRARQLLEEVCNELAKKIGEDKAELEMLKSKTMRICEEVEEEKNMLQLAEIWREERVQMKLVDAKLTLEHKYSQIDKLVGELEAFLRSNAATLDVMALRKAELIRQAVKLVNIQDSDEFEYVPPASDSIFSIFEELQRGVDAREMEVEPLMNYSPIYDASNHHIVSPEVNDFDYNHVLKHLNGFIDCNDGLKKVSRSWECAKHSEDQGSRCSVGGSDRSLNSVRQGKVASKSIIMYKGNGGQHSPNAYIGDECSVSGAKPGQKACSISHLRSDEGNGRIPNGAVSNARAMRKLVDDGCNQGDSTEQFVSPDLGNPHIIRGMKGFIEWPGVTRKTNVKDKHLKALMENQKTHLRKVLK